MSLDRRLREGIGRITSELDPDVDRHLQQAMRHARRRIAFRRAGAAVALAAALTVAVVMAPRALDALGNLTQEHPAGHPTPSAGATTTIGNQAIAGTYVRTISAGGADIRSKHLAGRWTLELRPDGTMAVTAPSSFTGVLSGVQFQVQADTFRTNLFVQDVCSNLPVATYRWTRVGDRLTFTPIDDRCTARVAVLSSGSWVSGG